MINHGRTLLVNLSGASSPGLNFPGEEYIPAEYRPLVIPGELKSIRDALFSPEPDRVMLNYRSRELLSLVHGCELGAFVEDFDPRITYWPVRDENLFRFLNYGTTSQQVAGDTRALYLVGNTRGLTHPNRLWTQFQIETLTSSTVKVERNTPPAVSVVSNYTVDNGLSSLVPIPTTELQFRFQSGTGSRWVVNTYARPSVSLPGVVSRLEQISQSALEVLFEVAPSEPFKTFRNLWFDKTIGLGHRLGGLVTAIIYRLDELHRARTA